MEASKTANGNKRKRPVNLVDEETVDENGNLQASGWSNELTHVNKKSYKVDFPVYFQPSLPPVYNPQNLGANSSKWLMTCNSSQTEYEHDLRQILFADGSNYSTESTWDNFGFEEYQEEFYDWNLSLEIKYSTANFLKNQPQVSPQRRADAVMWLNKLNRIYQFYPETFFLSVSVIDRFLATTKVGLDCLYLLVMAAFLVASKQVEFRHAKISELLKRYVGAYIYTPKHVLCMEKIIMRNLRYNILVPTAFVFLEIYLVRISKKNKQSLSDLRSIAHRLLELSIQDYELVRQYRPSLLAMAVALLADEYQCGRPWELSPSEAFALKLALAEVNDCVTSTVVSVTGVINALLKTNVGLEPLNSKIVCSKEY